MQYSLNYSGARFLSTENYNYSISWWIRSENFDKIHSRSNSCFFMSLAYVIPRVQAHKLVLTAARSRFASGVGPFDVTLSSSPHHFFSQNYLISKGYISVSPNTGWVHAGQPRGDVSNNEVSIFQKHERFTVPVAK